jgi:hypothetical protein
VAQSARTIEILRHLASRPGHDEVKADFRELPEPAVISRRSTQEKEPWKSLPGIEGSVEAEFLHPVLIGESILPYRVFQTFEGVIPVAVKGDVLDANNAANRGYTGLNRWMKQAEAVWNTDRPSPISFTQQLDYYGKLRSQFPIASLRVAYAASGTNPAACILRSSSAVIEHKLYWGKADTEDEALYLAAIFNGETARARTEVLQSRGLFGARDFDKVIFTLPIPRFDAGEGLHTELAAAARDAESVAAAVPLPEGVKFQRARKLVRDALTEAGIAPRIDALVARLLDSA